MLPRRQSAASCAKLLAAGVACFAPAVGILLAAALFSLPAEGFEAAAGVARWRRCIVGAEITVYQVSVADSFSFSSRERL